MAKQFIGMYVIPTWIREPQESIEIPFFDVFDTHATDMKANGSDANWRLALS